MTKTRLEKLMTEWKAEIDSRWAVMFAEIVRVTADIDRAAGAEPTRDRDWVAAIPADLSITQWLDYVRKGLPPSAPTPEPDVPRRYRDTPDDGS